MITKLFSRSALHEHPDPAQRVQGAAALPPDSGDLARLLAADPAPEVRLAAANRCTDLPALAGAWATESDPAVRAALAAALGNVLAETADGAGAAALLDADHCTDAIRCDVARRTPDADRRRVALAGIRDEALLVELALSAEHAESRMDAAERVHTPDGLRKLANAAKNKDRGVARLARQRIDAIAERAGQEAEADAIVEQLEALTARPGPILSAAVEIDRRWQALDMSGDSARRARWDAARQALQARFDREQDEQRARSQFERRLREWLDALHPPAAVDALAGLRADLAALREAAQGYRDGAALEALERAEQRIAGWERERHALEGAEALVVEAEQLAAGTSIDHANLPERWQALDRAIRGPALTQRFESALIVIEQRRLAQIQAAQQQANAARQQVHGLLHSAEQALAAGQLHAARVAADEIRAVKAAAGVLPKPTVQRLSRLVQQLSELERWESFGQRQARVQLCERAEGLATQPMDASKLALEVQKLRGEWKALDEQHAGVPKSIWERFDGACEKAYAPAARHFAEMAAQRKEARRQREEFIAAAAAHAPTLLAEPRDWRAIERWLRETDRAWREGNLGSVEPGAWKKLDARLKAALGPVRDALAGARDSAKAGRLALIAEATALVAKAMERDVPSQVKAIQARWQEHAKAMPLAQRDERALWEELRAACDAVFNARHAKRKEDDDRRQTGRRALEETCEQLVQLAQRTDGDEQDIRRALREMQEQWKQRVGRSDPPPGLESRFRNAKGAVETMLSARVRSRESAVWQTLAAKERLCEELDHLARSNPQAEDAAGRAAAASERWAALPALAAGWEKKLVARRDAALRALSDPACGRRARGADRAGRGIAARVAARARNAVEARQPARASGAKARAAGETAEGALQQRGGIRRQDPGRSPARLVRAAGRGRCSGQAAVRARLLGHGAAALNFRRRSRASSVARARSTLRACIESGRSQSVRALVRAGSAAERVTSAAGSGAAIA